MSLLTGFNVSLSEIGLLVQASQAAFVGGAVPPGWSVVTPAQLGLAAQYSDGIYFTDPGSGASAIVLQQGTDYVVSFRGTDDSIDTQHYIELGTGSYIHHYDPLLNALGTNAPSGAHFSFTGASLGGAATNLMADIAGSSFGGRFAAAKFVGIASPIIKTTSGILNLGFENDPIYKGVNNYADFSSSLDNFVLAADKYMAGNYDGRHPLDAYAHSGFFGFEALGRITQSAFFDSMTPDSVVIFDVNAGLVQDVTAGRENTGVFYFGDSVADNIAGRNGNDFIEGFGGDDILSGRGGDDSIAGGAGVDTAVYSGSRANYVVTYNAATQLFTIADQRAGRPDGIDTVTGVERLQFADGVTDASAFFNHAPVLTASNLTIAPGRSIAASSLFSLSDADGGQMSVYGFLDGNTSASSGHFVFNGVIQAAGQYFLVSADQLSQVSFVAGAAGSDDNISLNAFDGFEWGNGTSLRVFSAANHAPVLSSSNMAIGPSQSVAASSLFSVSDADGGQMSVYGFLDGNTAASSGHFVFNGVTQAAGQYFLVSNAQLSQVNFVGGAPGSDDNISINAFDGFEWGNGTSLHVSTAANHAPVLSAADIAVGNGQSIAASNLFSLSDADGGQMSVYGFLDGNASASSGHFVFDGVTQAAGQYFLVSSAQLSQVSFVAGAPGSNDNISLNAFDGFDWGNGTSLHVSTAVNHAPVLSSSDIAVGSGQSIAAASLFSVSDADGGQMSVYGFLDGNTSASSGHFVFDGVTQAAGQYFLVPGDQLSKVSFTTGSQGINDPLTFNAFDGTDWGAGTSLNVNVAANHASGILDPHLQSTDWLFA